ncbi:MAG: Minf_1886 family protein [bacterium]
MLTDHASDLQLSTEDFAETPRRKEAALHNPSVLAQIDTIVENRGIFRAEAYTFVLDSLELVLQQIGERRHITGEELLEGIKDHARERFGPMAKDVLNAWGVHNTLDFGRVVFHLVEAGILKRKPEDSLSDFIDKYDFTEAFEVGYFENQL